MNVVSRDLAVRLQAAGLKWEPKAGDWCIGLPDGIQPRLVTGIDDGLLVVWLEENGAGQYIDTAAGTYCLWLPTGDDCLEAIRSRGLYPAVAAYPAGPAWPAEWGCQAYDWEDNPEVSPCQHAELAEATGLALAAVLEGEKAR